MMQRLKGARGFLARTGAVSAAAALLGVGLGAFATGGGARSAGYAETPLGANPGALVADSYEGYALSSHAGPVLCQDCGPGLHERRALAKSAAWEAALARYETGLDELAYAPQPEPAVYFKEDRAPPKPELAFKPMGELAVLDEEAPSASPE